jgi:hypothetical protein
MEFLPDRDAPTLAGGRVLIWDIRGPGVYAHDIPHPIGDPDDDDELPDDDEDDEDDDEEPLQVRSARTRTGSILHCSTFPFFLL